MFRTFIERQITSQTMDERCVGVQNVLSLSRLCKFIRSNILSVPKIHRIIGFYGSLNYRFLRSIIHQIIGFNDPPDYRFPRSTMLIIGFYDPPDFRFPRSTMKIIGFYDLPDYWFPRQPKTNLCVPLVSENSASDHLCRL